MAKAKRMHRFRRFKMPVNVCPQVMFLFQEMQRQRVGIKDMGDRSGVSWNAIMDWRIRQEPGIHNLEACYNVLGFSLKPTRHYEIRGGDPSQDKSQRDDGLDGLLGIQLGAGGEPEYATGDNGFYGV